MTTLGHFAMGRLEMALAHRRVWACPEIQGDDVKKIMLLWRNFSIMKQVDKTSGKSM